MYLLETHSIIVRNKLTYWRREMSRKIPFLLILLLIITACGSEENKTANESQEVDAAKEEVESVPPVDMEITEYGEELGLTLAAPSSKVETMLELNGSIEKAEALNEDNIWVTVTKSDKIEEINESRFEYYIPVEDGDFSKQINLHHGEGEYRVTVRLPSDDQAEENKYFDAANFKISNQNEEIERDVEYTQYGIERELELSKPVKGYSEAEEMVELSGTLGDDYKGERLFAEVKKDGEKGTVVIPIENGSFSGEVPLYYGQGTHSITLQIEADDEENMYYDSAILYVNNESSRELPEFNQFTEYHDSGLILETPSETVDIDQNQVEYPVKGMIEKNASRAKDITHVIVTIEELEEHEKALYFIPVENYKFEGVTHFRFGPGEYEVTFNIPEEEQGKGSTFYYTAVLSVNHNVTNIEDKRDILPSRGTESDDPKIIEKAEEITDGIKDDRKKAKAIYEYVSKNVEYDVEKFKRDEFNLDDSAISTLESGIGICQDYTFLTTALLRSIDVESRYVEGYAGGRHAWVEAHIGGEWIVMDPTWGAGYVDGDEFTPKYNEDYFDPDPEFLEETHMRQGIKY